MEVTNYLLTGMTLQVAGVFPFAKSCPLIRPYVVGVALGGEG